MRELTNLTWALLDPLLAEPHQPRLTFYDGDSNRTELSTASLVNWSAKIAGLLTEEVGAAPGALVQLTLPPGWLHLPVLLGAWWAGLTVTGDEHPDAVAAFVAPGTDAVADEVFVVSAHPLGLAAAGLAPHQRDLATAARPHADRYSPPPGAPAPALPGLSVADVLDRARAAAVEPGARVLLTEPWTLPDPGIARLLGPLVAAGSLVAVASTLDPDTVRRIADAEHAMLPA